MKCMWLCHLACWLSFLLLAAQFQQSIGSRGTWETPTQPSSSSCQQAGCVTCQSGASQGTWPRASGVCTACADTADQGFRLQQGRCVCKPGHGLIRKQAPPVNNIHGCRFTRQEYTGHHSRLLLDDVDAHAATETAAAAVPAAAAEPAAATVPAAAEPAAAEPAAANQAETDAAAAAANNPNATASELQSRVPQPAADGSSSSDSNSGAVSGSLDGSPTAGNTNGTSSNTEGNSSADADTGVSSIGGDSLDNSTSTADTSSNTSSTNSSESSSSNDTSITAVTGPPDSSASSSNSSADGSSIVVIPESSLNEGLKARLASLSKAADERYKATIADNAAKRQAAAAAAAEKRLEAANQLAEMHRAALAKAREAAAAANEARKEAVAANATNASPAVKAAALLATATSAKANSTAEKVAQAVAAAQERLAKKRAQRKAAIEKRWKAQLADVTAKLSKRKAQVRPPPAVDFGGGSSSSSSSTRPPPPPAAAAPKGAATPPAATTNKQQQQQQQSPSSAGSSIRTATGAASPSNQLPAAVPSKGTTAAAGSRSMAVLQALRSALQPAASGKQRPDRKSRAGQLNSLIVGQPQVAINNERNSNTANTGVSTAPAPSGSTVVAASTSDSLSVATSHRYRHKYLDGRKGGSGFYPKNPDTDGDDMPRPPQSGGCSSCNEMVWVWVPCAPCPPGMVSEGGDPTVARCTACPFGSRPNKDQTECEDDSDKFPPGTDWPPKFPPWPFRPPAPPSSPSPPSPPSSPRPGSSPGPPSSPGPNSSPRPSPKPSPKPPPINAATAKDVKAFTLAPQSVFVDFKVGGNIQPLRLSIVKDTGPKSGKLDAIDQKKQRVKYTPNKGYCSSSGTADKFKYQVVDGDGNTATATASVTVDCPDAVYTEDAFVTTPYGVPVDVTVPVGGGVTPYKVKIIRPPTDGQVQAIYVTDTDITFTYLANDTYCSAEGFGDSFEFQVKEVYGTTAVGYIDVTVLCPDPPLVAPELIFNMTPNPSVLPIDFGVVGSGPFTFQIISDPLNGKLDNITDTGLTTYRPDYAYCSMFDFYDSFYYTVYDKYGQFVDAAVTINVLCPDPPYAETQNFETPAQVPLEQHLIVNSTAELLFDISLYPSHGVVEGVDEKGVSLYTPDYDFCSMQDTLDNWGFDVQDIYGQYAFALVFIKVVCPPPPAPQDQQVKVFGQLGQVINITLQIPTGTLPYYIEVSIDPMNGFITPITLDEKNPKLAYTRFSPFDGYCNYEDIPDPFNWMVTDPFGQFGEATCAVFIKCPDAPTAKDQQVQMLAGEKQKVIQLQVTGMPPLEYLIYAPPGQGTLSKPTADNKVTYTPKPDFCSIDGFVDTCFFTVSDAFGAAADGSLTITVLCPPEPSTDDVLVTIRPGQASVEIMPTLRPSNSQLIVAVSDPPGLGTVTWDDARKVFTYMPKNGSCQPGKSDDFIFSVNDIYGQQTAFGSVTIDCPK